MALWVRVDARRQVFVLKPKVAKSLERLGFRVLGLGFGV